jgi:hypothetical protein
MHRAVKFSGIWPTPHSSGAGPVRALVVRQLFLDAQLSFLEESDGRKIRHRAAQFIGKFTFKAIVFELQCAEMRLFHKGVSLSFAPRGCGSPPVPDSVTMGSLQLSSKHIKLILRSACVKLCGQMIPCRDQLGRDQQATRGDGRVNEEEMKKRLDVLQTEP